MWPIGGFAAIQQTALVLESRAQISGLADDHQGNKNRENDSQG